MDSTFANFDIQLENLFESYPDTKIVMTYLVPNLPKIYLWTHFCTEFDDKMRPFTMFFL